MFTAHIIKVVMEMNALYQLDSCTCMFKERIYLNYKENSHFLTLYPFHSDGLSHTYGHKKYAIIYYAH